VLNPQAAARLRWSQTARIDRLMRVKWSKTSKTTMQATAMSTKIS